MSYLVLARKWRPQTFDEVVGQGPVVRTLQNALKRKRVAHAMLFSGVRGVGKTTLARIMAKALNCQGGEADDLPCCRCESCGEIAAGAGIDLHEIDGASNRGIQEIRELKENIRFAPIKSRYKIIIIDEVHMLTTEAFNALLKTLEEPPEHVFFMFATTELHKVPVTILSRCQRYELKRVSFAELVAFFEDISVKEKVDISRASLEMIAREADGSVRDGLSLLDQILSFSGDKVLDEDVIQVLGLADRRIFETLARTLLAGDLAKSLACLDDAFASGMDLNRFMMDLLGYFRSILICRLRKDPEELLNCSDHELAALKDIAASYGAATLYNHLQFLLNAADEMQNSHYPRLVLEMSFIKAVEAGNVVPVASLIAKLDALLDVHGEPPSDQKKILPVSFKADFDAAQVSDSGLYSKETDDEEPVDKKDMHTEPALAAKSNKVRAVAPVSAPHPMDLRKHWDEFIAYVMERKAWMAHALMGCSGFKEEGGVLILNYESPTDCMLLEENENLRALTEFALDFFQTELKIVIRAPGTDSQKTDADDRDGPQAERRALANDPVVLMTTEVFDGQVTEIRTGPRSR